MKRDITIHFIEMQRNIREYSKQLYINKLGKLDIMENFLDTQPTKIE